MDSGLLYFVADSLQRDFSRLDIEGRLSNVIKLLAEYERQPRTYNKQDFGEVTSLFFDALKKFELNNYTISQKVILNELGAFSWIGNGLSDKVRNVLNEYKENRPLLIGVLSHIAQNLGKFIVAVRGMASGFRELGVEKYDLSPGDVKIIVVFSDDIRKFTLEKLEKDIHSLNVVLKYISEVVGGGSIGVVISSIGSSEFTIVVDSTVAVAVCFASVVTFLLNSYNSYLDIQMKRRDLKEQGYSDKLIGQMEEESESKNKENFDEMIRKFVDKYIKNNFGVDDGRRNELIGGVRGIFEKIYDYIKSGVDFDVDARREDVNTVDKESPEEEDGKRSGDCNLLFNQQIAELEAVRIQLVDAKHRNSPVLAISSSDKEQAS